MKPQSNAWVMAKITLLILGAAALYTHIGQLVPQKEVLAPTVIDIDEDATPEELADIGRGIAEGKSLIGESLTSAVRTKRRFSPFLRSTVCHSPFVPVGCTGEMYGTQDPMALQCGRQLVYPGLRTTRIRRHT